MEDCLTDRLWTDLDASKKLVDNINTLFQPSSSDQEDEAEENVIGRKSSGTAMVAQSNKPSSAEGETSVTTSAKPDPSFFPLDSVKVEQRLNTPLTITPS